MSFEAHLVSWILEDLNITALIDDRLEPHLNAQDEELPRMTYKLVDKTGEYVMEGQSGFTPARYQFDLIDDDYDRLVELWEAFEQKVSGHRGYIGSFEDCTAMIDLVRDETEVIQSGQENPLRTRKVDVLVTYHNPIARV